MKARDVYRALCPGAKLVPTARVSSRVPAAPALGPHRRRVGAESLSAGGRSQAPEGGATVDKRCRWASVRTRVHWNVEPGGTLACLVCVCARLAHARLVLLAKRVQREGARGAQVSVPKTVRSAVEEPSALKSGRSHGWDGGPESRLGASSSPGEEGMPKKCKTSQRRGASETQGLNESSQQLRLDELEQRQQSGAEL